MLKKVSCLTGILLLMACIFACEPPEDATIAKVITSATSVAFTQILQKNPAIEDDIYMYAVLNKQVIVERTLNAELAKAIFNDVLQSCKNLDAEDKELLITLFSTILPLIEIPPEGALNERTRGFMVAFLDGIINVVETKRAMQCERKPYPGMWETKAWIFMEALNGLHRPTA